MSDVDCTEITEWVELLSGRFRGADSGLLSLPILLHGHASNFSLHRILFNSSFPTLSTWNCNRVLIAFSLHLPPLGNPVVGSLVPGGVQAASPTAIVIDWVRDFIALRLPHVAVAVTVSILRYSQGARQTQANQEE